MRLSIHLLLLFLLKTTSISQHSMKATSSLIHSRCSAPPSFAGAVKEKILSMEPFDNIITLSCKKTFNNMPMIIEGIVPPALQSIDVFCEDIRDLIIAASSMASKEVADMSYRLALLDSVKCPKWHEDYVKMRLLKTYHGVGTEYCDPEDISIRISNYVRTTLLNLDPHVAPSKVKEANTHDVLILTGRNREGHLPVLHRSPKSIRRNDHITDVSEGRRLLLTITIP